MKNGGIDIYRRTQAFSRDLISTLQGVRCDNVNKSIISQLVRSGTSIGANLAEADGSPTRKDFINKISVSLKEGKETLYWLDLLQSSGSIDQNRCAELLSECEEIVKILVTIRKKSEISATTI